MSKCIYHFFANNELMDILYNSDINLQQDNRNKIEDIDNFKRYMQQRNLWTDEFDRELELYLKFNNN